MLSAYNLPRKSLPEYSSKFSRRDFTLPQLFACLVVKEQMRRSYRGVEALLRDCDNWCRDVGLTKVPDHNTLCRAAAFLLRRCNVGRLLDKLVEWAALAHVLGLSTHPLAVDSTPFESRHVSRHYERRCHQTRRRMKKKDAGKGLKTPTRSDTVRGLPKLGIGVATRCHLVISAWTGTGAGADQPQFEPVPLERLLNSGADAAVQLGWQGSLTRATSRTRSGTLLSRT